MISSDAATSRHHTQIVVHEIFPELINSCFVRLAERFSDLCLRRAAEQLVDDRHASHFLTLFP